MSYFCIGFALFVEIKTIIDMSIFFFLCKTESIANEINVKYDYI